MCLIPRYPGIHGLSIISAQRYAIQLFPNAELS